MLVAGPETLQTRKCDHGLCADDYCQLCDGFPYRYHWHRCGKKDWPCKVTARGKMNSCRVEFPDGFVMITSRNAVRRYVR